MTDDEIEELIGSFRAGHDLLIYTDVDFAAFLFVSSNGTIHIFTDELEVDDKYKPRFTALK